MSLNKDLNFTNIQLNEPTREYNYVCIIKKDWYSVVPIIYNIFYMLIVIYFITIFSEK